jgi:hypothetical protein
MILGNRGQRVCRRVFRHESSLRPISAMPRGPKGDGQTRRVSSVTHRAPGLLFPIEIGADIGTSLAAGLADESRLQIGQRRSSGHLSALMVVQWLQR